MEVIYGKKTPLRGLEEILIINHTYPHHCFVRKPGNHFPAVRLIWLPQSLVEYSYYRFQLGPVYASLMFVRPFLTVAICLVFAEYVLLWKDIRIKKAGVSKILFFNHGNTCVIFTMALVTLFEEPVLLSIARLFLFELIRRVIISTLNTFFLIIVEIAEVPGY